MLRIEAENFRSYPTLDWICPDGLTLIDGENQDSGGSNMAGKTTLFDAWFWCRYGWLPKWGGPKGSPSDGVVRRKRGELARSCWVKITEKFGPHEIEITRERPHKLTVKRDGQIQRVDQDGLEKLLGMSSGRFLTCVYMPQKRKRSFYAMSDGERTELLSLIAGLEDIDRALEVCKLKKTETEADMQRLGGSIHVFRSQLHDLPVQLKRLEAQAMAARSAELDANDRLTAAQKAKELALPKLLEEKKEQEEALIEPIMDRSTDIRYTICEIKGKLNGVQQILDAHKSEVEKELIDQAKAADVALKAARALEKDIHERKTHNIKLEERIRHGLHEARSVTEANCPACGQTFPEDRRQDSQRYHLSGVESLRAQLKELPATPDLEALEKAVQEAHYAVQKRTLELDAKPSQLRSEIRALGSEHQRLWQIERQFDQQIEAIRLNLEREYRAKVLGFDQAIREASVEKTHQEQIYQNAREAHESALAQKRLLEDQLARSEEDLKACAADFAEAMDLIEVFGPKGYRSICYDGLVNRISDRAGHLLGVMTDGVYSTFLVQAGEDSKGNQKLIMKPVVLKGGKPVPQDDLSGGGEDRISLAYDVAVAEVAGEGLPLMLDEVLTALDAVGKSEAMALLEEVAKGRPVLVVDHASEFKAMFNQVLKVIYQDEESRLEVS